jgi:hypothetical protein
MKQGTLNLVGIAALTLAIGAGAYWRLSKNNSPTNRLANGITVSVVQVPRDDLAQALDVRIWKINIVMPGGNNACAFTLNQYAHEKFVRSLSAGGLQTGNQHEQTVTFILVPQGEDMFRARQVKYLIHTSGSSISSSFPNPLQNCGGIGDGISVSPSQNRIYLLGGGKHGFTPAGNNDIDLAIDLKLVTFPPINLRAFPKPP